MTLPTLHYHPLSSYCHKVLIALEVLGIAVDKQVLNLGDPAERAAHQARWPLGKMPLLVDGEQVLPEASIIIEHLQAQYALPGRVLIPKTGAAALEVRLWDRVFDQYVMTPMQACTADLLRPEDQRDALGAAQARAALSTAYALLDARLAGREWVAGADFSLADCAAAPSLFYAVTYVPIPAELAHLKAYFERLMAHPAVAATVDQARPWFQFYPGRAGLDQRWLQ